MKIAIRLIGIGLAIALTLFLANERNRYAIFGSSGEVHSGGKFGVRIGQRIDSARQSLRSSGFREALHPSQQRGAAYGDVRRFYYLETGWRSGAVSLTESNNSVAAIGWNYQFGAP